MLLSFLKGKIESVSTLTKDIKMSSKLNILDRPLSKGKSEVCFVLKEEVEPVHVTK